MNDRYLGIYVGVIKRKGGKEGLFFGGEYTFLVYLILFSFYFVGEILKHISLSPIPSFVRTYIPASRLFFSCYCFLFLLFIFLFKGKRNWYEKGNGERDKGERDKVEALETLSCGINQRYGFY